MTGCICKHQRQKQGNISNRRHSVGGSRQCYHYIGLKEPAPGDKLGFLQMYIYDSQQEMANRTINQPGTELNSELIALLQEELDEFNAHVPMFRAFNISEQDPRAQIVLLSDTGVACSHLLLFIGAWQSSVVFVSVALCFTFTAKHRVSCVLQ